MYENDEMCLDVRGELGDESLLTYDGVVGRNCFFYANGDL